MTPLETRPCANPACRRVIRRPAHRFTKRRAVCSDACLRIVFAADRRLSRRAGAEFVDDHGYRRVSAPDHPRANGRGYVLRAWLIVEARDARPLAADEVVAYQDGDRTNLAPTNLIRLKRRSATAFA